MLRISAVTDGSKTKYGLMMAFSLNKTAGRVFNTLLDNKCRRVYFQYFLLDGWYFEPRCHRENNIARTINMPVFSITAFAFVNGNPPPLAVIAALIASPFTDTIVMLVYCSIPFKIKSIIFDADI